MSSADSNHEKQYSPACERNAQPILQVLKRFVDTHRQSDSPFNVLEIGSGTGQHAAYFAETLADKKLVWQPSDMREQHSSICAWASEIATDNCLPPLTLDLSENHWPGQIYDMIFTANTLHIVAWPLVERLFIGASRCLDTEGLLLAYGPFNYDGRYTSDSNEAFDDWLKQRDPLSGIRDLAAIKKCARAFKLEEDIEMPANNRLLVFRKHC